MTDDDIFEITKESRIITRILKDVFGNSGEPSQQQTQQLIRILENKPLEE